MKARKHGKQWLITYRCPGIQKAFNELFATEAEANVRIAEIQLAREQGTLKPPVSYLLAGASDKTPVHKKSVTVADLMDKYVNLHGLSRWSEHTLSNNQHRIRDYILPYIGEVPLYCLTTAGLEEYYQLLATKPAVKLAGREKEGKTISLSVIEKVHALMRSALNQAIRWGLITGPNPAMTVELPKRQAKPRDTWTDDEARHALEVCEDDTLRLCMYLALGCSMRIGEILGLTWDCVHIEEELVAQDAAYLHVGKELARCMKASVTGLQEKGRGNIFFTFPQWKQTESTTLLVLKTPKTESSVRDIYIPGTVAQALKKAKRQQEVYKQDLEGTYQDFNLIVAQPTGRPYENHMIAGKLRQLCEKNHLRPVVFHSLRHSSTSLKLRISGGDIKAVQGDTGHAQSNMVTDVYSHIMNDDRRRLAQKMDQEFFRSKKETAVPATGNAEADQVIALLQKSPELANTLMLLARQLGNSG